MTIVATKHDGLNLIILSRLLIMSKDNLLSP